jgi:hypothetical protein
MPYPRRALTFALALAAAIAVGSAAISGVPTPALSLGWYSDACDDAEAQNPGAPGGCRYDAAERECADGIDNDSDERADCADSDCAGTQACLPAVEDCANWVDDDGDAATDCADSDCAAHPGCEPQPENCSNWADDDLDGAIDCSDSDCEWTTACRTCDGNEASCGNGQDDDCDGATDCADDDCAFAFWNPNTWACAGSEICNNGVDDNGDWNVDCNDLGCAQDPICRTGCSGQDVCNTNCPEYSECACNPNAPGCGGTGNCSGGSCDPSCPGYDYCACNPQDPSCACQANPCSSAECAGYDRCECEPEAEGCGEYEICGNGLDDEGDGQADCGDSDCSMNCECTGGCTTYCEDASACNYGEEGGCDYCGCDGLDNNNDGQTDEEGEQCSDGGGSGGCSDPDADNYDEEASSEPHDENCEYSDTRSFQIEWPDDPLVANRSWLASAFGSFFAADPNNIQGFSVFIRLSLWKDKQGRGTLTFSGQIAPETGSGRFPMGAIQIMPTASFNKEGLTTTEAYKSDDDVQKFIHQSIDRGFYGQYAAEKHTFLQKLMDVRNWFKKR